MLTFILKKEWFEKIARDEKTVEYREIKPYWTRRLRNAGWQLYESRCGYGLLSLAETTPCRFRLGYTSEYLDADIYAIEFVNGKDTDLHTDKPVYAIHFKLKGENNEIRR